jgi:DNA-binding transcriptional LysR family regulator
MDWDKLKTFHASAEAGSLTGAAELLRLSQSAVSRQIASLEDDLGVKLFHRHTRGLLLTEPGRVLFESTNEVSRTIVSAESKLVDIRDEPSGSLRITMPAAMGAHWLMPRLSRFCETYPGIDPHLLLVDHELDISNLEADIGIRIWRPKQNDLIQKKLMDVDQHLYAVQSYLDKFGKPEKLSDLDDHRLLSYGPRRFAPIPNLNWHMSAGMPEGAKPRNSYIEVNTINALMTGAEAGLGIASLPDYIAAWSDRLVPIMKSQKGPTFETYLVYPEELKGSRRVAAFIEFITKEVAAWKATTQV